MKLDNSAQISQNEPHVMRKLIIINEQVFAFCASLLWLTLFTLCTLFTWIFTGYCCAHPSRLMLLILVLLVKNHFFKVGWKGDFHPLLLKKKSTANTTEKQFAPGEPW